MTALFPAAIDKIICFAFEKNNSTTSKIIAIDLDDSFEVDLTTEMELTDNVWTNYIRGVINQLKIKVFLMDSTVFSAVIFLWVLVYLHALECGFYLE
jgi:galactokinase